MIKFESSFPAEILEDIKSHSRLDVSVEKPIGGGDINESYLLSHPDGKLFIKYHAGDYLDMFEAEADGLQAMRKSTTLKVPKVILVGATTKYAYLLLEYIPSYRSASNFWTSFAEGLAQMHKQTNNSFGWERNNYIGRLPQLNESHNSWKDFYWNERILPQLELAFDNGYFKKREMDQYAFFYNNINSVCPVENPALIHGDLWSGNFMVDVTGMPVLIDPAVSYGHREMDLAMTKLFGGFDATFYNHYHEVFPLEKDWWRRMDFYQLYYILVHLNLFGSSYLERSKAILEKYS